MGVCAPCEKRIWCAGLGCPGTRPKRRANHNDRLPGNPGCQGRAGVTPSTQPGVEHIGAWGGSDGRGNHDPRHGPLPADRSRFLWIAPLTPLDDEFDFLVPYPLINPLAKMHHPDRNRDQYYSKWIRWMISAGSARARFTSSTARRISSRRLTRVRRLFDAAGEPRFLWLVKECAGTCQSIWRTRVATSAGWWDSSMNGYWGKQAIDSGQGSGMKLGCCNEQKDR